MREANFESLLAKVVDNRGRTCPTSDEGLPLIATNCVKNSNLYPTFEKVRYVSRETYDAWFRGHPEPGDLIFVTKGSPGQVCLSPDPVNFCIAQDMVAVRADPKSVYPPYLLAVLRSENVQARISNMHVGTLIPHFKKGDFDKLQIPLPSHETQVFAGDLYLHLSRKIDLNRRMNETLEAMARAIFKDWFVDFGPVRAKAEGRQPRGLAPDIAALFPDRLDDDNKPIGWQRGVLGDIAQNVVRSCQPNDIEPGTPYIALEHMPRRSIALTNWSIADKVESNKFRFQRGEFLFGKLRPYFHKVGIAPVDGVCTTDAVVVTAKQSPWSAVVLMTLSSDEFVAFTDQGSTGTKMPRASWQQMARYPIICPPAPDLARKLDNIVNPITARISANVMEGRTLSALRDLLLPKLMSGEICIRDAEIAVEAAA